MLHWYDHERRLSASYFAAASWLWRLTPVQFGKLQFVLEVNTTSASYDNSLTRAGLSSPSKFGETRTEFGRGHLRAVTSHAGRSASGGILTESIGGSASRNWKQFWDCPNRFGA